MIAPPPIKFEGAVPNLQHFDDEPEPGGRFAQLVGNEDEQDAFTTPVEQASGRLNKLSRASRLAAAQARQNAGRNDVTTSSIFAEAHREHIQEREERERDDVANDLLDQAETPTRDFTAEADTRTAARAEIARLLATLAAEQPSQPAVAPAQSQVARDAPLTLAGLRRARPPSAVEDATALSPGLHLTPIQIEDGDNLWDWIRRDTDRGRAFFQRPLATSMEMHDLIKRLWDAEKVGTGAIRSIRLVDTEGNHHIGAAMLMPVFHSERCVLLTVYLEQTVRPSLGQVLPEAIQQARALFPGYAVAIFPMHGDELRQFQAMLPPLGFQAATIFVLP